MVATNIRLAVVQIDTHRLNVTFGHSNEVTQRIFDVILTLVKRSMGVSN